MQESFVIQMKLMTFKGVENIFLIRQYNTYQSGCSLYFQLTVLSISTVLLTISITIFTLTNESVTCSTVDLH